jgi:small-conductance mechanosensitive channel
MINQDVIQTWITNFVTYLPKLISALIIFIVTLWGAKFIAKGVKKLSQRKIESEEINQLIYRVTRWTLIIIGTVVALDQINFDITGFIAGLGVAGFTIGFALQDIAKNFISGLLLLYRQPFIIGDWVKISDYTGEVKEINIRDTVIESVNGETAIIPNKDVFENPIINFSHGPLRRGSVMIGLGYEEDSDKAIAVFLEAIGEVAGVENNPKPIIRAEELGASTLQLSVYYWVNQEKTNILDVRSEVVKCITRTAQEHRINLPYPIQTIRLEKDS